MMTDGRAPRDPDSHVNPPLTVLMAVRNGAPYLRQAVDSILGQTHREFEFLIVNDGSTDDTAQILASYDDPRLRIVASERSLGLTPSLNRGLELARGALIARQDADDVSEPTRLSKQVAFMARHPTVALVGTWFRKIDATGSWIANRRVPTDCDDLRWSLLFFDPFIHGAVMFRKAVVEELGRYDESFHYAQDWELWSRIAHRFDIANLGAYLVRYRVHEQSMTSSMADVVDDETRRILTVNLAPLLAPDANGVALIKEMSELFGGRTVDGPPRIVARTIEAILSVHRTFCLRYGLDPRRAGRQRRRLGSMLARRLLTVGHHRVAHRDAAAARLALLAAVRHDPRVLLSRDSVALSVKLFLRGVGAARRCDAERR